MSKLFYTLIHSCLVPWIKKRKSSSGLFIKVMYLFLLQAFTYNLYPNYIQKWSYMTKKGSRSLRSCYCRNCCVWWLSFLLKKANCVIFFICRQRKKGQNKMGSHYSLTNLKKNVMLAELTTAGNIKTAFFLNRCLLYFLITTQRNKKVLPDRV